MKKYKKIILLLLIIVIGIIYTSRVWYVNKSVEKCVVKEYAKGEIVPFEQDFVHTSNMIIDGYSVEILENNIYAVEDFIEEYDISKPIEDYVKYIYTIDIRIYNDNKEEDTTHGIFLPFFSLISNSYYTIVDEDLTLKVNPNLPDISFSLRPESNMDIKVVYVLGEPYFMSLRQVKEEPFSICITQYPTRKILHLS